MLELTLAKEEKGYDGKMDMRKHSWDFKYQSKTYTVNNGYNYHVVQPTVETNKKQYHRIS